MVTLSTSTTGLLPETVAGAARDSSRLLTILAMAGLGFGVELAAVKSVGPRVGVAVVGSLLFLTAFTIAAIRILAVKG